MNITPDLFNLCIFGKQEEEVQELKFIQPPGKTLNLKIMKNKLSVKKRKILRWIYGTLSLSSALFVFQACYGTPHDMGLDVLIQGFVSAKTTNQPIPGIKASVTNRPQYYLTDAEGKFRIYTSQDSVYGLRFEDIDTVKNGTFAPKDTIVKVVGASIFLNVRLDVK
jgi:hypothetical protein